MDAAVLLVCLGLSQIPNAPFAPPRDAPSQFVPQTPTPAGAPTPAESPAEGMYQAEILYQADVRQPSFTPPSDGSAVGDPSREPAAFSLRDRGTSQPTAELQNQQESTAFLRENRDAAAQREPRIDDDLGRVMQAASQQPLSKQSLSESLLAYALQQREQVKFDTALTLRAAIETPSGRASTVRAVKGYWQLSLAIADHHHALEEVEFLESLPSPAAAFERAQREAALSAARARVAESELALEAAQQDLTEAAGAAGKNSYLPSDPPFVGEYRTNFNALFSNRTPPAGLQRIDRTLPILHRLIRARADATASAGESLRATTQAYQQGEVGFDDLNDAFVHLRGQRIAFLAAVRDYNYSIADYALSVSTSELGRDAIVSMLIETSQDSRSVLTPRRSPEPLGEGQATPVAPQTPPPVTTSPTINNSSTPSPGAAAASQSTPRFIGGESSTPRFVGEGAYKGYTAPPNGARLTGAPSSGVTSSGVTSSGAATSGTPATSAAPNPPPTARRPASSGQYFPLQPR
ncbi:MAG: hypothetical protein RIC55_13575 [Pirellulaceae bacterium]